MAKVDQVKDRDDYVHNQVDDIEGHSAGSSKGSVYPFDELRGASCDIMKDVAQPAAGKECQEPPDRSTQEVTCDESHKPKDTQSQQYEAIAHLTTIIRVHPTVLD